MRLALFGFALVVLLAGFVGCSSSHGPPTRTIVGKITLDDKPVTAGRVYFVGDDDKISANGDISAEGTYQVLSGPVGTVKIAVITEDAKVIMGPPMSQGGNGGGSLTHAPSQRPNPNYVETPSKYATVATSGLTATIPPGRNSHTHDIKLMAK